VPRVFIFLFFWLWGAKIATIAKLRGQFCGFFLGVKITTLEKLGG